MLANCFLGEVGRAASYLSKAGRKYANTRLHVPQFPRQIRGANLGQTERQTMPVYANLASFDLAWNLL